MNEIVVKSWAYGGLFFCAYHRTKMIRGGISAWL